MIGNEALDEEARAWVRQLLSGGASEGDARGLAHWRAQSPDHEAAFRNAARLHRSVRQAVTELRSERVDVDKLRSNPVKRPSRRMVLGGAIAASSAGLGLLVAGRAGIGPFSDSADYETIKGQTQSLDLAPGTSITLNTLTRVSLRPDAGSHAFELLAGEVIATVRSTIDRPLTVFAGSGRVMTQRGRFALQKRAADVDLSCLEGGVRLLLQGRQVSLRAGQAVSYVGERIGTVVSIDPRVIEGWRQGILIFRDRPLAEVIAEINRYRPGRIVLANPALSARRVSGTFYLDSIDQIFEQMRLGYGARISRLPGGVVMVS